MRKIIYSILFLFFLGGVGWLLFFSHYFTVKKVEFSGCSKNIEDEARKAVDDFFSQKKAGLFLNKNILFLSVEKMKKTILERAIEAAEAEIKKTNTVSLEIALKERKAVGVWCKNDEANCFYMDENGIIFKKAPFFSGGLMASFLDKTGKDCSFGCVAMAKEKLSFITVFRNSLMERIGASINHIELIGRDEVAVPVTGISGSDWKILFSFDNKQNDPEYQARIIEELLETEIKEEEGKLDYIDLRIKNRVYYKYKEAQIQEKE